MKGRFDLVQILYSGVWYRGEVPSCLVGCWHEASNHEVSDVPKPVFAFYAELLSHFFSVVSSAQGQVFF